MAFAKIDWIQGEGVAPESSSGENNPTETVALERHFTPPQLGKLWNVSPNTVRSWFEGRDDILRWGSTHSKGKRRHLSIRIPESVALKVYKDRGVQ